MAFHKPSAGQPNEAPQALTQPAAVDAPAEREIPASSSWDTSTKRTVLVILLVGIVFTFWISQNVLPWLIIAAILSYLLSPMVDLLTRVRVPRTISTVIVFAIFLILLLLLPIFLVPVLIDQLRQLASFDVAGTASSFFNWLLRTLNELPEQLVVLGLEIPTGNVVEQVETGFRQVTFVPTLSEVLSYIQQGITTATGLVSSTAALSVAVVGGIVQGLITAILVFFLSLYLTKDLPAIRRYVEGLFPSSYQPELREMLRRVGFIWSSFFRGQLILSTVIGTATWFSLTLVGMPGALVLGITAGALEVIPQMGPIIATIPAVIVALIQGSDVLAQYGVGNVGFALIIIAMYFIIQQVEASVLVPRIIGESVNLHPVVIICGVAVGYSTFGVLGAFLAAPTLATLRVIGGYVHAKLLDYPPFHGRVLITRAQKAAYRLRVTGDQLASEAAHRPAALSDSQSESTPATPVPADADKAQSGSMSDSAPRISSSPAQ